MPPYAITGIQEGRGPNGELSIRREIDEWWFSPDSNDLNQRSLFIYALKNFQTRGLKENDDLSYLNIAGIHGLPRAQWPRDSVKSSGFYCSHGKTTFPTWHTPYMLLYEQRIHEEMLELIPTTFATQDQDAMVNAANTWRLPFWDWAMKKPRWNPKDPDDPVNKVPGAGPNVPFVVMQAKVSVRTKTGEAVSVDNPLFNFAVDENFGKYGVAEEESPWPDLPKDMKAQIWDTNYPADKKKAYTEGLNQDYTKVTKQLQGSIQRDDGKGCLAYYANTLPEAVYRLIASVDAHGNPVMEYESFATSSFNNGQQAVDYPSLEAIHNNIHNFSGGNGFLGDPSTAAFDPLFWLHHCNVDRLLSIWQELYTPQTKKWLDSNVCGDGPQTELRPFTSDSKGTYYTSRTCSLKLQEFGYTYPELKKWQFVKDGQLDRQAYLGSIYKKVERLYSTTSKAALLLESNKEVAQKHMAAMTPANIAVENFPGPLLDLVPKSVLEKAQHPRGYLSAISEGSFGESDSLSWKSKDYVVNVVYERFALDGRPYSVTLFLGDVPEHSAYDFAEDKTAVGRVYNFSSTVEGRGVDDSGCETCKEQRDERALFSGQVILTDYLIQLITHTEEQRGLTLTSLDRDEVVEYLKKNLHWRVTDLHHNIIPKENMPSLKVWVAMAEGTHYSEANKPSQYSSYTLLWDATQGKIRGAVPETPSFWPSALL